MVSYEQTRTPVTLKPHPMNMNDLLRPAPLAVLLAAAMMAASVSATAHAQRASSGLIGYWPLSDDLRDYSGNGNHATNHGVEFVKEAPEGRKGPVARFNGRDAYLEVPHSASLALGDGEFSVALWVHTAETLDDVLGDLMSKYDPQQRRGFQFGLMNYAGVTCAQSNFRHLQFGIDDDRAAAEWTDCGRPGNNLFVCALAVHDGHLYAGTFETGADEAGHVYRWDGGTEWTDCGSPDRANSVMSLAVFDGELYAGTARYNAGGSALDASQNEHPGGKVYRYAGDGQWIDCGKLGEAAEVFAMAVYNGQLYAIPLYSQGVFRYDGEGAWIECGTPGVRLMALTVFNGGLYGAGNEGNKRGGVYRYLGETSWEPVGYQEGVDQVYSFAAYQGRMHVGTWPEGKVFRDDGSPDWTSVGRLGEELEVMGMAVYNGGLYAGTLPLAQVYRYDADDRWTLTGRLDHTPEVKYRRAWSMAVYRGRLFCGTLPSGQVYSYGSGGHVTHDRELEAGWRHVAAVRRRDRLHLYIDGEEVASSEPLGEEPYDLTNQQPLRIGFGPHDYFNGDLQDVRLYGRALPPEHVAELAGRK